MTKNIQEAIDGLQAGKVVRVYVNGDMLRVKEVLEDQQVRVLVRGQEQVIDLPADYAFAIHDAF